MRKLDWREREKSIDWRSNLFETGEKITEKRTSEVKEKDKIKDEKVNIIIGSDLICCTEDAIAVVETTSAYLKKGVSALFICPAKEHRFGIDALLPALQQRDLLTEAMIIRHSSCCLPKEQEHDVIVDDELFQDLTKDHFESTAFLFVQITRATS